MTRNGMVVPAGRSSDSGVGGRGSTFTQDGRRRLAWENKDFHVVDNGGGGGQDKDDGGGGQDKVDDEHLCEALLVLAVVDVR